MSSKSCKKLFKIYDKILQAIWGFHWLHKSCFNYTMKGYTLFIHIAAAQMGDTADYLAITQSLSPLLLPTHTTRGSSQTCRERTCTSWRELVSVRVCEREWESEKARSTHPFWLCQWASQVLAAILLENVENVCQRKREIERGERERGERERETCSRRDYLIHFITLQVGATGPDTQTLPNT